MAEKKTIKINPKTHKALKNVGKKGETFDDVILKLLDYYEGGGRNEKKTEE